jgi:hypothetical protein
MSSVRDRIERQRSHQEPEPSAPARPRSPLAGGDHHAASTRERAQAREFETSSDLTPPIDRHRATGLTSVHSSFSQTSVRGRLDQQLAVEQAKNAQPSRTANAQYWLDAREEEQRTIAARAAERDREMQERIARDKAIEASNARALIAGLAFDQFDATPEERRRILALPGAADASPEKLVSMLLTVRELHEFNEACSEAEAEARRKK